MNYKIIGIEQRDIEFIKKNDMTPEGRKKNVLFFPVKEFDSNGLFLSKLSKLIDKEFDSSLILEDDLIKGTHRLLEVDNRLVLPVGVPLRILITSSDVLHS